MENPSPLRTYFDFSPELEAIFDNAVRREEFPKGHRLFRQGDVYPRLHFIEKGIARFHYDSPQGKDVTLWFGTEGGFIVAIDSFTKGVPTRFNCELLEPSALLSLTLAEVNVLIREHSEVARTAFYVTLALLNQHTNMIADLKFCSAKERFDRLMEEHRDILQRVPLGHIASYLGITQETLSRLRAQK